jgi:hypothetical protein
MVSKLTSFCESIEKLNGEKYLLYRSDERELKRTVESIIVRLSLQSTNRPGKIVVVTETDRKARAFNESLRSHGLGPHFSSCTAPGEPRFWMDNMFFLAFRKSTKVRVDSAGYFFNMCSDDHWLRTLCGDPARMLVVYLDVTLDTLLDQKVASTTGWAQAERLTSVLAACGRIERESHEQLLGWKFVQANMEFAGEITSGQAGCPLFTSVLTRDKNNQELDYRNTKESLVGAFDKTVIMILTAVEMISSGGIVVIGSDKDLVIRLADRTTKCLLYRNNYERVGIETEHVFCPQRQDATESSMVNSLLYFDGVAGNAGWKALLLVSLRAVKYLETIESAFKHAKLIFFVGLPFIRHDLSLDLKLYATFDLMNSFLRELLEFFREKPDCRALFIMDKHVTPDRLGMLASELHDTKFEDFLVMAIRLHEFLARYQPVMKSASSRIYEQAKFRCPKVPDSEEFEREISNH